MSPQVVDRSRYSNKTDIWSTGVVFVEMATLKNPRLQPLQFTKLEPETIVISDTRLKPFRVFICSQMLVANQDDRANIDEVIASPVFNKHYKKVSRRASAWLRNDENLASNEQLPEGDDGDDDDAIDEQLLKEMTDKIKLKPQQIDTESQVI